MNTERDCERVRGREGRREREREREGGKRKKSGWEEASLMFEGEGCFRWLNNVINQE